MRSSRKPSAAQFALLAGLAVGLGVALWAPGRVQAGGWHRGTSLVCSDCHTMHNSRSGQPMRYDNVEEAAPKLLRAANVESLCEQCHSGGTVGAGAPKVVGPPDVSAPATFDAAGGYFTRPIDAGLGLALTGLGHTLGVLPDSVPLSAGLTPAPLTCVACHEAHGNDSYRNLLPRPGGGSVDAKPVVDITIRPDGKNPYDAYDTPNMVYRSGMSQWCQGCHNGYSTSTSHPSDLTLASYADVYAVWSAPILDAVGAPIRRLRVQNPEPLIPGNPIPTSPSSDDLMFCLTCHKAHGSPNPHGLVYPVAGDANSGCAQCHGAAIPAPAVTPPVVPPAPVP